MTMLQGNYFPYFMKEALLDAEREIGDTLRTLRGASLRKGPLSLDDVPLLTKALASANPDIAVPARKALRNVKHHKRDLRRAYRDARIADIRIEGAEAAIRIAWGVYGYTFNELKLRRKNSTWTFSTPPWGDTAVMSGPVKEEYSPKQSSSHAVSLRMDPRTRWAVAIAVLSAVLLAVPLTVYLLQDRDAKIPPQLACVGMMVGAIYGITAVYITLSKERDRRLSWAFLFLLISVIHVLLFQPILR